MAYVPEWWEVLFLDGPDFDPEKIQAGWRLAIRYSDGDERTIKEANIARDEGLALARRGA